VEIRRRLSGAGLGISIGGFNVAVRSTLPPVLRGLAQLYADYPLSRPDDLVDFRIELAAPGALRRWFRPQVSFAFDGKHPFKPLPLAQSFAMFEWGLNWVVANHAHEFVIIHAATVEKDGRGYVFPGTPGSGKSTLCAALVCRGWRLLSDEMALLSLRDGLLWPVPRPISLKNRSIEIIRGIGGDGLVMGDVVRDTAKGTVAHMRAPRSSVALAKTPVPPFAVVFPTYREGSATAYAELPKATTVMRLAENCFNYATLGAAGFNCIADAVTRMRCHTLVYSDLDDAIGRLGH
jgi:HprK-related kinase A